MKNKLARFTCNVEGTILTISLSRGKRDISVLFRQKEKDKPTKNGRRKYFSLGERSDEEITVASRDADLEFQRQVDAALKSGWVLVTKRGGDSLEEIPAAPSAQAEPKPEPKTSPRRGTK